MKLSKKFVSILCAVAMLASVLPTAAADIEPLETHIHAEENVSTCLQYGYPYVYRFSDGLTVEVKYTKATGAIIEETTIYRDGQTKQCVLKEFNQGGALRSYVNGVLVLERTDINVFGDLQMWSLNEFAMPLDTTYFPCGYNVYHMFVEKNEKTINISNRNTVESILASLVGAAIHPIAGAALGIFTAIAQQAFDCGADYIDTLEYKYFVPDMGSGQPMNCFHTQITLYSYTSSGARDVYDSYWRFYQYLL